MTIKPFCAALCLATLPGLILLSEGRSAAQTPPSGAAAWAQCSSCHALKAGAPNTIGPNLYGVAGKKAGGVAGYTYSPALKVANIVWTDKALDQFLAKPSIFVKGNKMAFPGIADAARRKAIIDYMKQRPK